MSFATTAIAIPAAILLPVPMPGSWTYIGLSAVLQVGYGIFLAQAYRHGELGQVYPMIRGSVPLLVTLGGLLFAGQRPARLVSVGIVLVSMGIASLSLGRARASTKTVVLALLTALFVASYVTADGIGVRLAGNAQSYVVWIVLAYGALMPLAFLLLRRRLIVDPRSPETLKAVIGGGVSLLSYGLVIAALALGKLGPVSALRETSIVFSVVIGRVVLGEALSVRRVLACLVVMLGVFCISYDA
ncbi:MAG TPA: EamA family transporter [Steroidobacteraceae bacterium]|nr:EamA family transporter [Steroidobacteraceae bacterium]